ncbi:hypothetical protein EYC84_008218 [Monilinia fructicola]|uniref:Uncharacterized protein n=1 Tax=Monilinia fructicola TaxID=38448 RepID=A0A5M9JGG3_MONFR|nr:hypothetical protein EYC84_008218 [Monilinia fructicola]
MRKLPSYGYELLVFKPCKVNSKAPFPNATNPKNSQTCSQRSFNAAIETKRHGNTFVHHVYHATPDRSYMYKSCVGFLVYGMQIYFMACFPLFDNEPLAWSRSSKRESCD